MFSLPVTVLAAGASVYIVESGVVGDDILGPAIEFFASDTTRVLLCAGACDVAAGSNVVDAARFGDGEEPLPFPPGIAFAGNLPNTMEGGDVFSYVRGSFLGAHPNFTANDWFFSEPTR